MAQSEERDRTNYFSPRWEGADAGHLMPLRHLARCCATSVARGKRQRSAEACLLWAAEEFSLIGNLVPPAMVRSRRFP